MPGCGHRRSRPSLARLTMMRVGATVALLLVIQLGVAAWVHRHDPESPLAPDSPSYERSALALLDDHRFWTAPGSGAPEIHRTPAYPALIAGSYLVFGSHAAAIILVQLLMNGAMLTLVGWLVGRVDVAARLPAVALLGLDVTF